MNANLTTRKLKKLSSFIPFVLALLGIGLLFSLGVWQWNRGIEKQQLTEKIEHNAQPSVFQYTDIASLKAEQYKTVQVQGTLQTEKPILLANRFFNKQVGYELFLLFSTLDHKNLLINTGWLKTDADVQQHINQIKQSAIIDGVLYLPTKGFTIGDSYVGAAQWPLVVQYLDFPVLSKAIGAELLPVVIVTNFESAGLKKIWNPSLVTAERHYGYAVQWWGLTLVLLVFSIIWLRLKLKDSNKTHKA